MNPSLGETATLVPLSLIVVSGLLHLRHFKGLREDLTSHNVVPAGWLFAAGGTLVALEIGFGIPGVVSWLISATHALRIVLIGLGLLYLLFTAYSIFLLLRRPGASCGCSRFVVRNNAVVPGRAFLLAVLSFLAAWRPAKLESFDSPEIALFALAPALSLAVTLYVLPATVEHPASLAAGMEEGASG
jgi:hypothetical protein